MAKVFTLALVMSEFGPDPVTQKFGTNATGLPFNSVIALELHKGGGDGNRQSGESLERR